MKKNKKNKMIKRLNILSVISLILVVLPIILFLISLLIDRAFIHKYEVITLALENIARILYACKTHMIGLILSIVIYLFNQDSSISFYTMAINIIVVIMMVLYIIFLLFGPGNILGYGYIA